MNLGQYSRRVIAIAKHTIFFQDVPEPDISNVHIHADPNNINIYVCGGSY